MKAMFAVLGSILIPGLVVLCLAGSARAAGDNVPVPKDYGVYAKTDKALTRIIPNQVHDELRVFYLERNKPASFPLNSIRYFIIYGKYDMQYLTLNNLKPFQMTSLGIRRYMFGLEVGLDVQKISDIMYRVKPKGLFGRGYYALWINDSAWDFIIE